MYKSKGSTLLNDFFNKDKCISKHIVPTAACGGKVEVSSDEELSNDEEEFETGLEYVNQYEQRELAAYEEACSQGGAMSCVEGALDENKSNVKTGTVEKAAFEKYSFNIRTKHQTLPIDSYRTEIIQHIDTNAVVIIDGHTGCGKTTQVPQFILDDAIKNNKKCNIIVTQPRRIAAISVAKRVSEERGWPPGTICGYQVGLEKLTSEDTILTYVTTGVLLQKLIKQKSLAGYTHILIDEIHERTQEMDFLLLIIRRFLYTNSPGVKIILMSATFDTFKFAHYFRTHSKGDELRAPTISINKESNFSTSYYYADQLPSLGKIPEYSIAEPMMHPELYEIILKLIMLFDRFEKDNHGSMGHVLVFLPGILEIEEAYSCLSKKNKSGQWKILPLHSSITSFEQKKVFDVPPSGVRKIILSTNIAESSITVADIEYVIDSCLTKRMTMDPLTRYQFLKLEWASQVNCVQRSGRVGRVRDGRVYRLVPEVFYKTHLSKDIDPEIKRAPLERIVLCTKLLDLYEPPKAILALAIDPPHLENIESTIYSLKEAGALLTTCRGETMKIDGDLTFLGTMMSNLPLDIHLTKMICLGYMFSCLDECIIMAAGCSLSNIFTTPFQEKFKSYANRLIWADGSSSDLIAYLNLYRVWERLKRQGYLKTPLDETNWCNKNYLSYRAIREWNILVSEIRDRLNNMNIKEGVGPKRVVLNDVEKALIIKIVICGAFYPNYYKRSADCCLVDEREAVKTLDGLDPVSTVYFTNMDPKQPGRLYAKRIKSILKDCGQHMKVHFNASSKVFVNFIDTQGPQPVNVNGQMFVAKMPGKILVDVYKAVRLRQIQLQWPIQVLKPAESLKRIKQEQTASHHVNYVKKNSNEMETVLPGLRDITILIRISYIIDAGNFYAQPAQDEIDRYISVLDDILNNSKIPLQPLKESVTIGNIYAAVFDEDRKYYRCKVISLLPIQHKDVYAKILFIDYGNVAVVPERSLRVLPPGEAEKIPPLAMECILCGVQPSIVMNPRGLWSERANDIFRSSGSNYVYTAKVYSVVNGVVSVELFRHDRDVSLNQFLICNGFAQPAEDSFLSKENHTKRLQAQNYNEDISESTDEGCYTTDSNELDPPAASECTDTIYLKGPYSPLEMNIFSIIDESRVTVDSNSVNTVLLDSEPQDLHERLTVAVHVSKNPMNSNVTIRHTTMMPNIPGFPALMALLFSPKMTLKPTEDGMYFGGVLCGLGENNGKPLYPARDFVLWLDIELKEEDIRDINNLRFCLNMLAYTMEQFSLNEGNMEMMLDFQTELKSKMLSLLKKKRRPQPKFFIKHAKNWHRFMYDGMRLVMPSENNNQIWELHSIMHLAGQSSKYMEEIKHIQELHNIAKMNKPLTQNICKLCDVQLLNVVALRFHLLKEEHKERENEIMERNKNSQTPVTP